MATVKGDEPNGNAINDTSTDPTPCTTCTPDPICADCTLTELPITFDIGLEKTVDLSIATIGDEVNFTIRARNNSAATGSSIVISEILPDGFEYVAHTTTLGAYDESLGLWEMATLNAGEVAELYVRALVVEGTDYRNIALLLQTEQEDVDSFNDEASVEVSIAEPTCPIVIYNAVSANGDGANDYFHIECLENYPNNHVRIFNRWGNKVFEQSQYDNTWNGISYGRATIKQDEELPVGTYFYILELGNDEKPRTGYLYLSR